VPGKRHGDITKRVAEDVRMRRRFDAGLEEDAVHQRVLPTYKPLAERERRALEGGVVLVGRPTFKEYMAGLKRGWSDGLDKLDQDEELARLLENDAHFDEPDDPRDMAAGDDAEAAPKALSHQNSPVFSPLQMHAAATPSTPSPRPSGASPAVAQAPPTVIPPQPPILFVPFLNYIGISQIPLMIWGFFNQRHKVLSGAQAGYTLVVGMSRPIEVPESNTPPSEFIQPSDTIAEEKPASVSANQGDLDFDKDAESYYKSSLSNFTADIEKVRTKYYEGLPAKLATARELARGTREPTKEEFENPPPTEVELRAERLKKEKRWRDDVEGWEIINPEHGAVWDERFRTALRVYVPSSDKEEDDFSKTS
jgi:import inner membrane translocase subunit TIM54